jgi:hypothetical protein
MIWNPFKKKAPDPPPSQYLVATLNARLQPVHRGEFFEDPLIEFLAQSGSGEVSGGGTMLSQNKEVEFCDIEIAVPQATPEIIEAIIARLEQLGAPKGSKLHVESEDREIPFGQAEGLAVYLNGTDLPEQVYQECDSNFVFSELDRLAAGVGRVLSHWQGPTETAFYLYGKSFAEMQRLIQPLLTTYPLCQKHRVVQIA